MNVPQIDISALPDDREVAAQITRACETWGFFQVTGHGIDADTTERFLNATRAFFERPLAERNQVRRTETNPMGFYDEELTKNTKDWKQIFDFGSDMGNPALPYASRWPEPTGPELADFQTVMTDWYARCEQISNRLLAAIELGLGVRQGAITRHFSDRHTSFLRLNYYPVCDDPAPADAGNDIAKGQLGIHRHTDAGALTVLVQDDVPALQVNKDDRWHTIEPVAGGLIINVGDMLQVWSNDRFKAPEHRVIANAERARFSAPFFYNPAYETDCVPLTEPAQYKPVNWGHFRDQRASGDYADVGEEIQISRFRIPSTD